MSTGIWKVKVANAGLIIIAGSLTIAALICLVFFSSPLGKSAEPAANAGQLYEQYKVDAKLKYTSFDINPLNPSGNTSNLEVDAGQAIEVGGSGTGPVAGSDSSVTTGNGSTPGESSSNGTDGDISIPIDTPGANSSADNPVDGIATGINPTEGNTGNPATGDGTSENGVAGGGDAVTSSSTSGNSDTEDDGNTDSGTSGENRVKSACFGGADGHCYTEIR